MVHFQVCFITKLPIKRNQLAEAIFTKPRLVRRDEMKFYKQEYQNFLAEIKTEPAISFTTGMLSATLPKVEMAGIRETGIAG